MVGLGLGYYERINTRPRCQRSPKGEETVDLVEVAEEFAKNQAHGYAESWAIGADLRHSGHGVHGGMDGTQGMGGIDGIEGTRIHRRVQGRNRRYREAQETQQDAQEVTSASYHLLGSM